MTKTIQREITLPAAREVVWHALADRARLAEWMYPNDFEPRVGHRFTFRVPPNPQARFDGVVRCEVLECAPPGNLVFTWVAVGGEINTRVSYRLERDDSGTRLFFEHSGFTNDQAFKGAEYGWTMMHGKLAKVLGDEGRS